MLEIIAVWALCKRISKMVKEKGRSSTGYIVLTIVLWIGGEIVGAILGAILLSGSSDSNCGIYIFALVGALIGGAIAYAIAKSASDVRPATPQWPSVPPASGPAYAAPPAAPLYEPAPAAPAYEPEAPAAGSDAGIDAANCPTCGYLVTPADNFCPSCGSKLSWQ